MGEDNKPTFMQNVATNWAAFRLFLWNSEKKEFLGRNGKSWAQIGLFYLVFYIFLALFWALMLFIFMQTVSSDHPTFNSYVNVPGLSIRPRFHNKEVVFNPDVKKSYQDYVDELDNIWDGLDPANQTSEEFVDCVNDTAPPGQFCRFDREAFGPCRPPNYGWDEGSPCLYLTLNRVSKWIPEDYEDGEVPDIVKDAYVPGNIAIHCMNYKNKRMYSNNTVYPSAGLPFEYFPFVGTTDKAKREKYIQPYAAVQFEFNVEDEKIKVHCQTYVSNIAPLGGLYDTDYESEVTYEFILSTKTEIGLFYLIYYICLAGFWALMLYIFLLTVSLDHPTFNSYVGRPGLSVTPITEDNLIKYSAANDNDYDKYTKELKAIWDSLDPANQTEGYVDCTNGTTPPEGSFCRVDRTTLGEFCVPPDFGYNQRKPCVFISLNRVVDWAPEDYEEGQIPKEVEDSYKPGNIAIKCGSYKNKKPEQLGPDTRIYPYYGIPNYYYPYVGTTNVTKRAGYIKPYIAVRFDLATREEDIKVLCKTYTGNIAPLDGFYDTKFESEIAFSFHLTKEPVHLEL